MVTICTGLSGYAKVGRNLKNLPDEVRPAIVILDADEEVVTPSPSPKGKAPTVVKMSPELFILDDGRSDTVGPTMNAHRAAVVKAILTDTELKTLVGPSGSVEYLSCVTGLATGRSMEGEMGVYFAFTYILDPTHL